MWYTFNSSNMFKARIKNPRRPAEPNPDHKFREGYLGAQSCRPNKLFPAALRLSTTDTQHPTTRG